ncbi:MAG: hypothetical protein IPJ06_20070 [Saprospiraceae bacterium]|nr:hypothetical protein [Saprospiraceae bacterium]
MSQGLLILRFAMLILYQMGSPILSVNLRLESAMLVSTYFLYLVRREFSIELHEGGDANQDGMISLNVETVLVGQGYHLFQEEDKSKTIFNVALADSTGQNCVALSDSTDYLAIVKYVPPSGQHYPLELLVQREPGFTLNRTATYSVAKGGLGLCRPLPTTFLSTAIDGQQLSAISGEAYGIPLIRLALDEASPVQTLPTEFGGVRILPNPVNEFLTVEMDFEQNMTQVNIRISDITGKVMVTQTLSDVLQTTWTQNVQQVRQRFLHPLHDYTSGCAHREVCDPALSCDDFSFQIIKSYYREVDGSFLYHQFVNKAETSQSGTFPVGDIQVRLYTRVTQWVEVCMFKVQNAC